MRKAVFLFNKTLVAPKPWLDAGYECWMFDGQHQSGVHRDGNIVRVGMYFESYKLDAQEEAIAELVGEGVEFVCSFSECTYLTTTGARWFYHPDDKHLPTDQRRPHPFYPDRAEKRREAVAMARMVETLSARLGTSCWMLENPAVSNLNTMWRRPNYKFDPYEYGMYLPVDDIHPIYPDNFPPRDAYTKNTGIWAGAGFTMPERKPVTGEILSFQDATRCGGESVLTKNIRSCTPRGFALALFEANGVNHA